MVLNGGSGVISAMLRDSVISSNYQNGIMSLGGQSVNLTIDSSRIDNNVGAAGVYGPPDLGFPEDGVVAQGALNQAMWLYADLDLTAVTRVRMEGKVFNDKHWAEQPGAAPLKANVVQL